MAKRIYRTITFMTITVSMIVFFASSLILVNQMLSNTKSIVKNETEKLSILLNYDFEYLDKFDVLSDSRITLISSSGEVLYDNTLNIKELDNHSNRPEVINALKDGVGQSTRTSDTKKTQLYYYALKLNNGNVIRLSQATSTIWGIITPQIGLIVVSTTTILLISLFIANWQTKNIIKPINNLDLQNPLTNDVYPELTDLLLSLEEHNKLKREFSANVSHELKTPLTSISGFAEIMANGMVKGEDQKVFSQKIYDESQRLITKINDIIKVSKLDENKVEQDLIVVNYKELINDILNGLKPLISSRNIKVATSLSEVKGQAIKYMMYDALYNIIQNGIKYNKVNGSLFINLNEFQNNIYIIIKDTGIGIEQADIGRIFERFFRGDRSHSQTIEGTGLGLAITKHSIAIHNGTIEVYSKLEEGTTFELKIPKGNI